jgi:hypothetical protein
MGIAKTLAVSFGLAALPVAGMLTYAYMASDVVYQCKSQPENKDSKSGAVVVKWNLPPLVGERGGSHSMAILDGKGWVAYSEDGNDAAPLQERAKTFCTNGTLQVPAP